VSHGAAPGGTPARGRALAALSLAALGVVYGDIGTSPLYALKECFTGAHSIPLTNDNVLGVLSLIFWSLNFIVSFKYILCVMKADNRGEGGILALLALIRPRQEGHSRWVLVTLGLFGAALLYGDGVITPAISVLGAVEGLKVATSSLDHVVWVITIVILAFYLLIDGQSLFVAFARLFPPERRAEVTRAGREISTKVSAWMIGQLILAGTIGLSSAIGLYLLGVPYFYVLALISAAGELIPVVGPILSAIPAAGAALTVSPKTALWVLVFFFLQQQAENHLLVPKIMQRQVGVSAAVVIAALLIGGALLGIVGAVLAIPTAAILQVVLQAAFNGRET